MLNYNRTIPLSIIILVIFIGFFATFSIYSVSTFAYGDFYKRLELRANIAADQFLKSDTLQVVSWPEEFVEKLNGQKEYYARIDAHGNLLENYGFERHVWDQISKTQGTNLRINDVFYATKIYAKGNKRYVVGVSSENISYLNYISHFRNFLIGMFLFGVLLIVIVSFVIRRSFILPVLTMIQKVDNISTKNLHERLELPEKDSMLRSLSQTFNQMLIRLETSFEMQKNFISNASHELNTPLTSIVGTADLALSKERSGEEYKKALQKILDFADNLEKKTHALLLLARTGYEKNQLNFRPVRIDQIILDAEDTVKTINEKYRVKIDFSLLPEDSMRLKVNGLPPLLQLAVSNIISNACKYSEDHTAYVGLGVADRKVIVFIEDRGIGIPREDLDFIYDTYFRGSNVGNYNGYGIGLPLSRNIILMHDGEIEVKSEVDKGTVVTIQLPTVNVLPSN